MERGLGTVIGNAAEFVALIRRFCGETFAQRTTAECSGEPVLRAEAKSKFRLHYIHFERPDFGLPLIPGSV